MVVELAKMHLGLANCHEQIMTKFQNLKLGCSQLGARSILLTNLLDKSSVVFDQTWGDLSVLGSHVFREASMESCGIEPMASEIFIRARQNHGLIYKHLLILINRDEENILSFLKRVCTTEFLKVMVTRSCNRAKFFRLCAKY